MGFQISAGVNISEIDLTTVVPAVSTTEGAIAGVFRWGPLDKLLLIDSEDNLKARYGAPSNLNAETWFTSANFLAYGNKLYVSRAANTVANTLSTGLTDSPNTVFSAVATTNTALIANTVELSSYIVKNEDDYDNKTFEVTGGVQYVAKYPGALGNSLKVSVCDSVNAYSSQIDVVAVGNTETNNSIASIDFTIGSNTANVVMANSATGDANGTAAALDTIVADLTVGDILEVGNTEIGKTYLRITTIGATTKELSGATETGTSYFVLQFEDPFTLSTNFSSNTIYRNWEYFNAVDIAPGTSQYQSQFGNSSAVDELHVVVSDEDGIITGVPGTILEVFEATSRATDAKYENGASNYYKNVINNGSQYIWFVDDRTNADSNTAVNVVNSTNEQPMSLSFVLGADGDNETSLPHNIVATAYDKFRSAEDVDISLILTGKSVGGTNGEQKMNYLIDNIAEVRRDCVVFGSPHKTDVVNNIAGDEAADTVTFRNSLRSTSYAVLDSGYKYQYDKYNDVYRWIPLNGDTAGLCVRTDNDRDPWWSPAGFNRGHIKNMIKLAYNPRKADRDVLYKSGINPVVTFPGQGTVLYGDKTLLAKPSAFDRINVRRLFIVLEKAIAVAAKYTLFEFNDEFTRAQFVALVSPFLRDVQGRRGIYDYRVVCDETNNTGEVIDRNEFVGDIYIKPARSINFIQLNFIAVRTGVEFNEVIGQF